MSESFNDFKVQEAVSKILDGMSLREAVSAFDLTEDDNGAVLSTLSSMCKSLTAKDVYSNTPKFQEIVSTLVVNYDVVGDSSIQVEFAVNRSDIDSSGASMLITSLGNGGAGYIELSRIFDGVMNRVRRMSSAKYETACEVFKELVDEAESNEADEDKILVTIEVADKEYTYEMPNPSFTGLKKAANEAKGGDKYISVDAIKTSPVVGNFFADSSLVNDFYMFMVEWNNDNEDYYKQHYNNLEYEPLKFSVGKAYIKVVRRGAVDAFIDKFGNVYKPAGWNAPAKGVRYYITDYKRIPFDPHGSFLYGNRNLVPMSAESFASENEVEEAMDMFGMDDSFFNKEELLEFASDAVDKVNDDFKAGGLPFSVDYTGVWMEDDDRTVTVDFICFPNEIEYSASVKIDMRAIKSPNDLFKYVDKMSDEIKAVVEKEVE